MQHKRYGFGFAALAAAALFVSACSNATTDSQSSTSSPAAPSASPSAASSDATHNDADVTFAQGMIPHHQQAIEMSDMLLRKQGIDPEVISLADEIKNAQGPEIEQMQGWLQEWGRRPRLHLRPAPLCLATTCLLTRCPAATWARCLIWAAAVTG
jgi:uncharacterized protein (DUF305 family)